MPYGLLLFICNLRGKSHWQLQISHNRLIYDMKGAFKCFLKTPSAFALAISFNVAMGCHDGQSFQYSFIDYF